MADQFIGEIRMVSFDFAPQGWAFCNGQILSISQNTALFSLLGTHFGGDGTSNFALPNLQGSAPMHQGQGQYLTPRELGESGGAAAVRLTTSQIPAHSHLPQAGAASNEDAPGISTIFGGGGRGKGLAYAPAHSADQVNLAVAAVQPVGESQPHNNLPPYLGINFVIALFGIYPTRD